jgi:hypothetical protein
VDARRFEEALERAAPSIELRHRLREKGAILDP